MNALWDDITRVLNNKELTDKEKLEMIKLATDLYKEWYEQRLIK